jgi:hypothetical protein
MLSLYAVIPSAPQNMPTTFRHPTREVFRAMYANYESVLVLICSAITNRKWPLVSYLVKCDPSHWIQRVGMHDQLQPFAELIQALSVEPHPLPVHSQPAFEYNPRLYQSLIARADCDDRHRVGHTRAVDDHRMSGGSRAMCGNRWVCFTHKTKPPHPSLLGLIVNHADGSVVFSVLTRMCPIHKQYLGMVDVDVVIQLVQRSNQDNGGASINILLAWYDILCEYQLCDRTDRHNVTQLCLTQKKSRGCAIFYR